jgi:LmbE family N-acetylglucosaminyl deacetylase
MSAETGWSSDKIKQRDLEIEKVREGLGVKNLYNLRLPTTKLDTIPMDEMISPFSKVFQDFCPEEVLVPHRGDAHTDHQIVFDAVEACCKWLRYPSVKQSLGLRNTF